MIQCPELHSVDIETKYRLRMRMTGLDLVMKAACYTHVET